MSRLAARAAALFATCLVAVLSQAPAALADGDPASDVLLTQVAFIPADAGFSSAQQAALEALLQRAAHAGDPIRVALVPQQYDLGSITVLWRRPETYARFLGAELSLAFKHPVITVMPNGVGVNWPDHTLVQAEHLADGITVGSGTSALLTAARTAVTRLLNAAHVTIGTTGGAPAPASVTAAHRSTSTPVGSVLPWIGAAALALALVAAGLLGIRRRRPRAPAGNREVPGGSGRAWWAIPAIVGVPLLTGGLAYAATVALRGGGSAASHSVQPSGPVHIPLYPAGRLSAPDFTLRDQHGHPFSLAQFRGRPVLVTFVDPLCRNLCPLEAHVLNAAVDSMPPAQRPVIVAVSVDVWADTHKDLMQDFRRWSLVPQWHWGVGSHAHLQSIWRRYGVYVAVVTKRLAGVTVHYITHTEASYLIDSSGHERALFMWPFLASQVVAGLREIAPSSA